MPRKSRRLTAVWTGMALAGFLSGARVATPQQDYRAPPHADATSMSLNWILGRYRMPVHCEREDGSVVQIEDAIVFRPAVEDARGSTIRATFFGIDVADAKRCYNLLAPRLRDRRGVLYLTFISSGRSDIGISDHRRDLRDGQLTYQIRRGKLRVREIGAPDTPAEVIDFGGGKGVLTVTMIHPTSDAFKLLSKLAQDEKKEALPLRRLEFRIDGPRESSLQGYYLEDDRRWR